MKHYRIEWRVDAEGHTTMYWNRDHHWQFSPTQATIYTETQRTEDPGLPDNGIWVVLNEDHNPAGALDAHQLAAIGVAIRETIEAGCKRHWNQPWFFSSDSAGLNESERDDFIAEVQRRLAEGAK